jgi:hypothetical protein
MKLIPLRLPERVMQPQTSDGSIAELEFALEHTRELADRERRRADLLQRSTASAWRPQSARDGTTMVGRGEPTIARRTHPDAKLRRLRTHLQPDAQAPDVLSPSCRRAAFTARQELKPRCLFPNCSETSCVGCRLSEMSGLRTGD